jgi:hypothetical protein
MPFRMGAVVRYWRDPDGLGEEMRQWGWVPVVLLLGIGNALPVSAAATFADPGFQSQWRQGEAFAPNFWGPLSTARDGQQEEYAEGAGGKRLVQYFDKGRMELTNGAVTYGLLAAEMVKGQVQTGNASFQTRPAPSIPVAGDADNAGPTYAMIGGNGGVLLAETPSFETEQTARFLSATGVLGTYSGAYFNDYSAVGSHPDTVTHHNIPKAFCDFRALVGIDTIGRAISEPFWSSVKVGGQQKDVLIQVFERRVLTYTPTNPAAYRIEFANIGGQYLQWRYTNGGAMAPQYATPL